MLGGILLAATLLAILWSISDALTKEDAWERVQDEPYGAEEARARQSHSRGRGLDSAEPAQVRTRNVRTHCESANR